MKFWSVLQRRLIAGLVVIAPITATVWVLVWIFRLLDNLLGRFIVPFLQQFLPWRIPLPGLGLLVLFLLLLAVGWIAERAIGSRIVTAWHRLLERIPITRRIYSAANRIVHTVFGKDKRPFKVVVLVEFPSAGRWSVGFMAAEAPMFAKPHIPDAVSVFIPTTPNPTTGFLVMLPRAQVIPVKLSMDEAFTFILSAGAASPDQLGTPAVLEPSGRVQPVAGVGATAGPE
jgi:uncharacterized membrane protein